MYSNSFGPRELKKLEGLFNKAFPIKADAVESELQNQLNRIENKLHQLAATMLIVKRRPLWVKVQFIKYLTIFKTNELMIRARELKLIRWGHNSVDGFRYNPERSNEWK